MKGLDNFVERCRKYTIRKSITLALETARRIDEMQEPEDVLCLVGISCKQLREGFRNMTREERTILYTDYNNLVVAIGERATRRVMEIEKRCM